MTALFFIVYVVVVLIAIAIGLYLSQPGHSWATLKDAALSVLPGRSRPASTSSTSEQHNEEPGLAMKIAALGEAIRSAPTLDEIHARDVANAFTSASDEGHEEAARPEVVHGEP